MLNRRCKWKISIKFCTYSNKNRKMEHLPSCMTLPVCMQYVNRNLFSRLISAMLRMNSVRTICFTIYAWTFWYGSTSTARYFLLRGKRSPQTIFERTSWKENIYLLNYCLQLLCSLPVCKIYFSLYYLKNVLFAEISILLN